MMPGPSLHLPLEVNGMNIWQVLQGKVQLPKGTAPPGRHLQQMQQPELLQAATKAAPAQLLQAADARSGTTATALEQQQSPAAANRLCSPQAAALPAQLSSKGSIRVCSAAAAQTAAAAAAAGEAAEAASTDRKGSLAMPLINTATGSSAVAECAEATAAQHTAASPVIVSTGSCSSSGNAVSVQLHVMQGGYVQVQLVLPSTLAAKAATAADGKNLRVDVAADVLRGSQECQPAAASQPTHYTPTAGNWRLDSSRYAFEQLQYSL
jgi:hypothetical protein